MSKARRKAMSSKEATAPREEETMSDEEKDARIRELEEGVKKIRERIRKSERLTADDYAVQINYSKR